MSKCSECGEDLKIYGGRLCCYCNKECCNNCIDEHEENCEEGTTEYE